MDLLWKDIRFSIQSLRANPGFAIVAILTLALGIGATTAIFSVVNGVLLQPLPLHDPERLVMVWEQRLDEPGARPNVVAPRNYLAWQPQTERIFSSLAATFDWELNLTGQSEPEVVRAGLVTGNLFPTLGAKPFLGRYLEESDATEEAGNVLVLSHAFWQRKFGANPKAVGRRVQLDGTTYTIVGVMPREFFVPTSRADLWVAYAVPNANGRYLAGLARLKPGITPERAKAEMATIAQRMAVADPARQTHWGATVIPMHEQVVGNVRKVLLIVLAAVALLLLIGCVNIANLLLSRATGRRREMAVRSALGASRGRLIGQLLTESVILSLVAGILGVIIAGWATMLFVRLTPQSAMLPRMDEITVDGSVLAVTALVTLATGILFGLAPAIEASRTDLQTGLKSSGRGSSQDRRGKLFRNTLVVAEVALATVLLIGAGLLIKSFAKLEAVRPGVRPENVLTLRIVLPVGGDDSGEQRRVMLERILDEVRRVPGVRHAGAIISRNMPFTGSWSRTDFAIEGAPPARPGEEPGSDIRPIAGDYFQAMGVPLLSGRVFAPNAGVGTGGRTEFIVNEAFAKKHFPGTNALGRRLLLEWDEDLSGPIVGIVGDVRTAGLDAESPTAMYFNYVHDQNVQFTLTVATAGDPWAIQKPVTQLIRNVHPLIPISNVTTLEDLVSGTIARPRFNATMLTLFAVLGLLLASIGIYGVLSYSVAQRTQEMGIRMALGADPRDVLRLVVKDGVLVAVVGVVAGVVIALAATRVLATLLYGVTTSDPAVFVTVAATLTAVALVASYIPARRATRVDPMIALRAE